jgi:hypothetical protein
MPSARADAAVSPASRRERAASPAIRNCIAFQPSSALSICEATPRANWCSKARSSRHSPHSAMWDSTRSASRPESVPLTNHGISFCTASCSLGRREKISAMSFSNS